MNTNIYPNRRLFFKTLSLSGLIFSGVNGFSYGESTEKSKVKHWDVIVVGGGPGGVPAAVAAARNGARVLLVERYGFLGGMATTALVHPYMKYNAGDTIITRGLFEEFLDILLKNGAILDDRKHFDAEPMKWLLERFVLDSGADMLLHSQAIGVLKKDDSIRAVRVFHKGGVEDLSADIFIDSTGDGDISAWAGAKIEIGRDQDHACQPMTTSFRMAHVDTGRIPAADEINRLYDEAKARGEVKNPRENVLKFKSVHPDVIHFNTTRVVGKTSLDGWSMTEAEIEGRRQVDDMVRFLRKYVAGFENSYLMKIGPEIGVRESRRVMGKYVLTADDVLEAHHFDDGIACASYDIDIHNPSGTGTVIKRLKEGTYYQIPYRCLVPEGVGNLLVASRCISSTHEAHSSLRVMPIVWSLGQAGGTAAALCIRKKITPGQVDAAGLRKLLTDQGAYL
ncbi:FAD-dependent oxidoreductase [bacterium]|nr:FAD-dependent oxidoreductase [bacterium]